MNIQLSDHFTYRKLIRFVIPSIGMMVFTSIYGVVDGFFVSNFAGSTQFAALNLIMPFIMLFSAIGFMIGTGGTALVSMKLGEQKEQEANEIFSLLVYLVIVAGILMAIFAEITLPKVAILLGASDELLPYCVIYGRISMVSITAFMLQNMFQSFLVAAEKPQIGLALTIAAGVANMILDALLVGALHMGVTGAALATATAEFTGGLIPLFYFFAPNSSRLHLGRTKIRLQAILRSCTNGASEFMTNVSMSAVNMVFNWQLLRLAGDNGVSAYGAIMYVSFVFVAIFIGYSIGTAPIIGYNYGAKNDDELKNVYLKSIFLIVLGSIAMTVLGFMLALPIAKFYVGYDAELMELTRKAFVIYGIAYLFKGMNIYGSAFFTALNNGAVSAVISFSRTLFFQLIMVMILPIFMGVNGVFASVIVAEFFSLLLTIFFMVKFRSRYHYI